MGCEKGSVEKRVFHSAASRLRSKMTGSRERLVGSGRRFAGFYFFEHPDGEDAAEAEEREPAEDIDEGPSSEDIDRLDHESALCPDCGAEVWDAAEVCPKCFAYIGGNAVARPKQPSRAWLRMAMIVVLAVGLLVVSLLCFLSPAFNHVRPPD